LLYRFFQDTEKGEEESRVYNNLALSLAKLGKYREAHGAFNRVGSEATAQNNIGYLYMLDGKNKEAALAFEKAIELSPAFYKAAHENLKDGEGSSAGVRSETG
jgi:Flp pilus assembly protein TadD